MSANTETLSLLDYIDKALVDSDQTRDIRDNLDSSQLAVELAELEFTTRIVPLANVNFGDDVGRQSLGVEARRAYDIGTTVATGIQSSKLSSDNLSILNPYNSKVYVRLSQGLFRRWGEKYNRYGLTGAEIDQRRSAFTADRRYQELMLDAVRRYYTAVLSGLLLEQSERGSARASNHFDSASSRYRVGLVSKADVYRAELALLEARSLIGERKRILRRDLESLHELLALPDYTAYQPASTIVQMTPLIPGQWERNLLENRSDWRTHLLNLDRARLNIYHAKRNIDPDVNLSLTFEREGFGDSYDESSELDETNWTLSLDVRTTFDRFEEKNALSHRRLALRRLAREGDSLKRKIFRDVRESFEELGAQNDRHRTAIERARQSGLALELAELRYTKGMSSNLEVLDAETAYSSAQLDKLRSLVAYNLSVVRLGFNLGLLDKSWVASLFVPLNREEAIE